MNKNCLNKPQKIDNHCFSLNKTRANNSSLFKQLCSIQLHFSDYQFVLFDKTRKNPHPFFLIGSNKNKQHGDIQKFLFDKTRRNLDRFFLILKNKNLKTEATNSYSL